MRLSTPLATLIAVAAITLHVAPVGALGIVIDHAGLAGTRDTNPCHSPSGDQLKADGAVSRSVIFASAPVSIQRTKICGLPARVET